MKLFSKPDWKWIGISYCMFVVWHLLPTIVALGLFRGSGIRGFEIGTLIWMFFGLTLIGGYVGYKSAGVTIIEPAIASFFYVITLYVSILNVWGLSVKMYRLPAALAILLAGFAIVLVSAWVGEVMQARKRSDGVME
jgi:hypothetical protein